MLQRHCFHTCQAAASAADSPGNAAGGRHVLSAQKHIVVHHPGHCPHCGQAVPGIQCGRPKLWLQALGQRYFAGAGKSTCSSSYQSGLSRDVNRCIPGVRSGTLAYTVPSNGPIRHLRPDRQVAHAQQTQKVPDNRFTRGGGALLPAPAPLKYPHARLMLASVRASGCAAPYSSTGTACSPFPRPRPATTLQPHTFVHGLSVCELESVAEEHGCHPLALTVCPSYSLLKAAMQQV